MQEVANVDGFATCWTEKSRASLFDYLECFYNRKRRQQDHGAVMPLGGTKDRSELEWSGFVRGENHA